MGNYIRAKQEKWGIFMLFDKLKRHFVIFIVGILSSTSIFIAIKKDFLIVVPQVFGIIIVRQRLTIEAKEFIKSLFFRNTICAWTAKSPFSKCTGSITGFFKQFGNCIDVLWKRLLPFRFHLFISSNIGMTSVQSGHQ